MSMLMLRKWNFLHSVSTYFIFNLRFKFLHRKPTILSICSINTNAHFDRLLINTISAVKLTCQINQLCKRHVMNWLFGKNVRFLRKKVWFGWILIGKHNLMYILTLKTMFKKKTIGKSLFAKIAFNWHIAIGQFSAFSFAFYSIIEFNHN